MESTRLADHTRQRLVALLKGDHPDPERWMARLRELRSMEGVAACSGLLRLLAHLDLTENESERLLEEILSHRREISAALGRDPGLRVAAIDYLSNVDRRLAQPTIVEFSEFERTEKSASTDPLTGLSNRRSFQEALDREIRRGRRYGLRLALLLLDLDDFKNVNDLYGHLFGDLVLERAARNVRGAIRQADVACRYGGEEIAVILPETERLGAYTVAERIRERVAAAFSKEPTAGREIEMTVSGGIGVYPEDSEEPDGLVARADEALYIAKRTGKNRIVPFHHERRRWVRFPVRGATRVRLFRGSASSPLPVSARNVSRGGALVEATERIGPATGVRLTFEREGGARPPACWEAEGRVIRVDPSPGQAGAFLTGIGFDSPVPEECVGTHVAVVRNPLRASRGGGR